MDLEGSTAIGRSREVQPTGFAARFVVGRTFDAGFAPVGTGETGCEGIVRSTRAGTLDRHRTPLRSDLLANMGREPVEERQVAIDRREGFGPVLLERIAQRKRSSANLGAGRLPIGRSRSRCTALLPSQNRRIDGILVTGIEDRFQLFSVYEVFDRRERPRTNPLETLDVDVVPVEDRSSRVGDGN